MTGTTSDLIVFASATAKQGKEAALERALSEAAGPTRAQHGCVEFLLLRPAGAPRTIVAFERWASPADHQRHLEGDHVKRLMQALSTVLAEPPSIVSYEVLDR